MLLADPADEAPDGGIGPVLPVLEQVMADEPHHPLALDIREAEPAEGVIGHFRAELVMSVEGPLAVDDLAAARLPDVVEEARKPDRRPIRRHLVAGEEGVGEDVIAVIAVLGDADPLLELREDMRQKPHRGQEEESLGGPGRSEERHELLLDALGRHVREVRRPGGRGRHGSRARPRTRAGR